MGLDNRDYARSGYSSDRGGWSGSSSGGGFSSWPIWKKIVAVNVVVFLLQIFITRDATVEDVRPIVDQQRELYEQYDPFYQEAYLNERGRLESDANFGEETNSEIGDGSAAGVNDAADASSAEAREKRREQFYEQMLQAQLSYQPKVSIIQEWCQLDTGKVLEGQIWRVVTCGFLHSRHSIWHLIINMLFLFWFGERLESRYGSREFTCFYFVSLITASIAYIGLDLYTGIWAPAVGASGAIWGVTALYALLYPYERIYVYFLFPVQIRFLALIYFIFDLHPVLLALSGEPMYGNVAHAAHIGGALFGFAYWYNDFRLSPLVDRWFGKKKKWANSGPQRRPESEPQTVEPSIIPFPGLQQDGRLAESDEARMDSILEKISREGRESLTDEEHQFLIDTSEQLRD